MAITKRTDYAVRLMYELAQLPPGATLSSRDLCEAADVPVSFGAPLVEYLIGAGMIKAEGYSEHLLALARPATEITMADVIRASEPEFSLSQCTREPEICGRTPHCGVHRMWSDLDRIVWSQLESLTLAEVATGRSGTQEVGAITQPFDFSGLIGTA